MVKQLFGKKTLSLIVALCMAIPVFSFPVSANAVTTDSAPSQAVDYGLMDTPQEGVILHAWDWSFNNIKANMQKIADAGYTSVQVSPIQQSKEATKGKGNDMWWILYQPCNFQIDNTGNSALGTKADFQAMCAEAHKYGIHVIVDVVANHLGNQRGYDKSSAIPADIRDDSSCWHTEGFSDINYGNRYSITHGSMSGLPDLNTESTKIQNYVKTYLRECIDSGADGFRFDAAKHIGLPSEGSNFWPTVINDATSYYSTKGTFGKLYAYGEILEGTGGPSISEYTQYMSVTDNETGNGIRGDVAGHNAAGAASSYYKKGAAADKTVLWAESHDTYSNDDKASTYVSDSDINKTWAMVASRNKATALYYTRTNGWRAGQMGSVISTQCFSKEVSAVNDFHNFFNGQSEYLASSNSIAYNERGTSGVVLVNCGSGSGSSSVSVPAHNIKEGTYTDQVSGTNFTVSGGQIKGQIGPTGIAVVYNAEKKPSVKVSKPGGTYRVSKDAAISVDLSLVNATEGTYKIDGSAETKFTRDTTVKLGEGVDYGVEIKLTVTATDGKTTSDPEVYTYKKADPSAVQRVYFDNSSYHWNNVYAYIYYDDGGDDPTDPTGTTKPNTRTVVKFTDNMNWGTVYAYFFKGTTAVGPAWPGTLMTFDKDNGMGHKNYKINIPQGAEKVVFTKGQDGPQTEDITLGEFDGYWIDDSKDSSGHYIGHGFNETAASSAKKPTFLPSGTVKMNDEWPGVKMTLDDETGYYVTDVPEGMENGLVIFSDGVDGTTKRYPADEMPGMELNGNTMLFSANNSWKVYDPNPKTEPKTDPKTEPKTEPQTEPKTDPQTEPQTEPVKDQYMVGDINGDKRVSLIDAAYIQQYTIDSYELSGVQLLAANVDDKNGINLADAIYVQKYVTQYELNLPIGQLRTAS